MIITNDYYRRFTCIDFLLYLLYGNYSDSVKYSKGQKGKDMYAAAMKSILNNKSRAVPNNIQLYNRERLRITGAEDNSTEVRAQRKLIDSINNSPKVMQLKNLSKIIEESPRVRKVAQLYSMIKNSPSLEQQRRNHPIQQKKDVSGNRVTQMVRGTPHGYLRNDQYPRRPDPTIASTTSGPYTVPGQIDAWLIPGQLQGGGQVDTKFWLDVNGRNTQAQFSSLEYGYYHRGHVLARSLGGPGVPSNIVPLTHDTNYAMGDGPEKTVRDYLYRDRRFAPGIVHYNVGINYGGHNTNHISDAEKHLPNRIAITAYIHQGPALKANAGNLAEWTNKDPEPNALFNNTIDMNLADFNQPYPLPQYTFASATQGRFDIDAFMQREPNLVTPLKARLLEVKAEAENHLTNMGVDNGTDPRTILQYLQHFLEQEGGKLDAQNIVQKALGNHLITVWRSTSLYGQWNDHMLNAIANNLAIFPYDQDGSNDERTLINSIQLKNGLKILGNRFVAWMVNAIQQLPQSEHSNLGSIENLINQSYGLPEGASAGDKVQLLAAHMKNYFIQQIESFGVYDDRYALLDLLNVKLYDKAILYDKVIKAVWCRNSQYLM